MDSPHASLPSNSIWDSLFSSMWTFLMDSFLVSMQIFFCSMWVACGFHLRSLLSSMMMFLLDSSWIPCGFHVGSMRVPCGIHVGSMWFPCGFHVGSMWVPCGFLVSSMWVQCGFYVGSMWVPCGSGECFLPSIWSLLLAHWQFVPSQTRPPYPRPLCMARPPIIHHLFVFSSSPISLASPFIGLG